MTLREFLQRGERRDFAKSAGVSLPHLNAICGGQKRPSWELAVRISAATDGRVSVESLMGERINPWARLREVDPRPTHDSVLDLNLRRVRLERGGAQPALELDEAQQRAAG